VPLTLLTACPVSRCHPSCCHPSCCPTLLPPTVWPPKSGRAGTILAARPIESTRCHPYFDQVRTNHLSEPNRWVALPAAPSGGALESLCHWHLIGATHRVGTLLAAANCCHPSCCPTTFGAPKKRTCRDTPSASADRIHTVPPIFPNPIAGWHLPAHQ
jgi:hypothetical protein